MALFDNPYTTFYWSAIVYIYIYIYIYIAFLSYLTLNDIMTLKYGLKVTQDNSNGYYSKAWVRFSIRLS